MPFKPGYKCKAKLNGILSKIATMPLTIRNEVNRQMDDGRIAQEIATWLNTQEEVRRILDQKWEGSPISRENVQSWRHSDYQKWVRRREQVENLKELSDYALKLGEAAGGIVTDGSAAIAGGRIMEALETASDADIHKMVHSICELRASDIRRVQAAQGEKRIALAVEKVGLERKKYQRQTAELFIEWYKDQRAREILESRDNNAEKLEKLGRAIFGEDW